MSPITFKPPKAPKTKEPCSKCGAINNNRLYRNLHNGNMVLISKCEECIKKDMIKFKKSVKRFRKEYGIKTVRDTSIEEFMEKEVKRKK